VSAPATKVWAAIALIGLITFGIRFSFVYLLGRIEEVPPRIERALGFVPAAVLAALSVPAFIVLEPTVVGTATNPKLLAGIVATAVAWKVDDLTATIVAGMATLWTAQYLL
jgi:branched-subunit amino acid transport protein